MNDILLFFESKKTHIIVLNPIFILISLICIFFIAIAMIGFFTVFIYPISYIGKESLVIFITTFIVLSIYFGKMGDYIIISKEYMYLNKIILFCPCINRIKVKLNDIKFTHNKSDANLLIYKENDPWCEMGYCDWVEITYKGKIIADLGSNKNFEKIYDLLKKSINSNQLI